MVVRWQRRPFRPARGASYLLLVLVGTVATTVVFAVASLASARTSQDMVVRATQDARTAAAATLAAAADELTVDPFGPFRQVHPDELGRVCLPTGDTVGPGRPWDLAGCGPIWDVPDGADLTAGPTRRTITYDPPSGHLQVAVTVTVGQVTAGWETTLTRNVPDLPDVATTGPAHVDRLWADNGDPASWNLWLNDGLRLTLAEVTVAADRFDGTFPDPDDTPTLTGTVPFGTLAAHINDLAEFACPRDDGPGPQTFERDGQTYATYVCVGPGRTIETVTGPVTIPDNARRVVVYAVPEEGGELEVGWSTRPAEGTDCPLGCNVTQVQQAALERNTHPSHPNHWDATHTILPPASGLTATTIDTYIGLPLHSHDPQPLTTTGTPAPTIPNQPTTIIAGTLNQPANLHIAAPVGTDEQPIGLIATGDLTIDQTASAPGSPVTIHAHATALGYGSTHPGAAVRPRPDQLCVPGQPTATDPTVDYTDASCSPNQRPRLHWHGRIYAPTIDLTGGDHTGNGRRAYRTVAVTHNPTGVPWPTAFQTHWWTHTTLPAAPTTDEPDDD